MPKAAPPTPKTSAKPNTMTGLAGWVEVFRAGSHTDSKNRAISFSHADLDQMVTNHQLGAAPAVIGHPTMNSPAYAWVAELKRDGDSLFARFEDINPDFEAGVQSGAYRNRSVSVFPDKSHGWRVRHVGWLGAKPPAIEGLQPVEFSEGEAEVYEFSAPGYALVWAVEAAGKLLRGLREWIVAEKGIEEADKVLPVWQIDGVIEGASQARTQYQEAEPGRYFSQPENPGGSMSVTKEAHEAAIAQARKEAEDAATANFAAKDQELIRLRAERRDERIAAQIKEWKAAGTLLPAHESGLAEFMAALEDAGAEFTFAAGDGKDAKKTPSQFFSEFMASLGPLVKLGRVVNTDGDPKTGGVDLNDAKAISKAAHTFRASEAREGREISFDAAVAHVTTQGA